jgi:dTDP-4-dehydrorhamnose reductase
MVACDLRDALSERDESFLALTRSDLDITDQRAVARVIGDEKPTVIINCAAFTKVDAAEKDERLANAINGSSVEFLAHAANDVDALLVQISTDFVFEGSKRTPYEVNDTTHPLSAYGRSKLLGEQAATHAEKHLIVRTSWLFGVNGPNFVEAIRNQIRKGTNPLRVVDDQRVAQLGTQGIVHYADDEECSWFDFAKAIVEECGADITVKPVSTDEFPRPAKRPAYSVLSTERYERVTSVAPESWRDGLRDYLRRRA